MPITLELVEAARIGGFDKSKGWPQALLIEVVAWLQAPQPAPGQKRWTSERRDQFELLRLVTDAGELEYTSETVRVKVSGRRVVSPGIRNDDWPDRYTVGGVPYAYERPAQYRVVTRRLVTAQALAAWLRQQGQAPSGLIRAWFTACGVQARSAQQEPTQAAPTPDASADIAKRAALVARLEHEWPTIEADLNEASRNGLREAAHAGKLGFWRVDKAREWAQQRGKLRQQADVRPLNSPWHGAVHKHRLKG